MNELEAMYLVTTFLTTFLVFILIVGLIVYIVSSIVLSGIFAKAGVSRVFAFIPFCNAYFLYDIAWTGKVYLILMAASIVVSILSLFAEILALLGFVTAIASVVVGIIVTHKLSKAFGHGVPFTLLLLFIPIIGYPILAFGSDEYMGAQ